MKLLAIGVHPQVEEMDGRVTAALCHLFPIRFISVSDERSAADADAVILLGASAETLSNWSKAGRKVFAVDCGKNDPEPARQSCRITFGSNEYLDARLRARTLPHDPLKNAKGLEFLPGDVILAGDHEKIFWLRRELHGLTVDMVALAPPKLSGRERASDFLKGTHFISLLPLVHFLRQVTASDQWVPPPPSACFMFDDPNLHWPSYGYVDFPAIAAHARRFGYHMTFATVPLDSWYANSSTVRLMRESGDVLSLLIHGNNHTANEMASFASEEDALRFFAQSLSRIEDLEKKTNLRISRVMVPPHEANRVAFLPKMLPLGFEAVCVSTGSLTRWNPEHPWPPAFGLDNLEILDGFFPVIPRFGLNAESEGDIVISAFLNRPIVPVGHHATLSEGLGILEKASVWINSLGKVAWLNPEEMLHAQFHTRRSGSVLSVRPDACHIQLKIPEEVREVVLHSRAEAGKEGISSFQVAINHLPANVFRSGSSIPVCPGDRLDVRDMRLGRLDHRQMKPGGIPVWAMARRLLCEARDRCMPVFS